MLALYLLPALALYALFVLWPLGRLALLSLQHWDGLTTPTFAGLDNYGTLLGDPGVGDELRHTLIWTLVTLTVPVLAGLVLALLLSCSTPGPRALLRAVLVAPLLFPTVVIAVAWKLFYNPLSGPLTGLLQALHLGGLAQDWLGDPNIALPALLAPACWASFGLSMLIFEAALGRISPAVRAAAALDGAGAWARLWWITLPALRNTLPLAMVITALCAVPSYDLVLLMTNGGPGYATTTIAFDAYGRAFGGQGQVGEGAALACCTSCLGLILAGIALLVARGQDGGERDAASEVASGPGPRRRRRLASGVGGLAAALTVAPLAWLLVLALQPAPGQGVAATMHDNLGVVGIQGFGRAMGISLGLALAVAVATLLLAIPAAFALAMRRGSPLQVAAAVLLALGLFQPTAVLIIPLFYLLASLRLLNSLPGVALPQTAHLLPMAVLLLWAGMRALPAEVLEAAIADGAAPRQVLRYVVLPLQLPLITVVGVWAFLSSWDDYLLPTAALQDEGMQTVPLALAHFIGRFDTQYSVLATGALLAVLPLLGLYAGLYGVLARGVRRLSPFAS